MPGIPAPRPGLAEHRGGSGGGAALTCVRRTRLPRRSTRRCLPGAGAPGRAAPRSAGRPCCARRPPRTAPRPGCPQPAVHARPRRQPPRTRGSRFPAQRREGGREAGAGRGRAFPASPGPSARPPAPCAAAANPEGAPGGRAPLPGGPPGGPPGAHLSLALCAVWSFGEGCQVRDALPRVADWGTESGPRSAMQPGPEAAKPELIMQGEGGVHPLNFEGSSSRGSRNLSILATKAS